MERVLAYTICIGYFVLGASFGSWTPVSVIFAQVPLRILTFRQRQRLLFYDCQTIACTKIVNVCPEHFFC